MGGDFNCMLDLIQDRSSGIDTSYQQIKSKLIIKKYMCDLLLNRYLETP